MTYPPSPRDGRPAWTGLCRAKDARFYQVTGQSSETAAGDRSDSRHTDPPAWLRVIPPPPRTLSRSSDRSGHTTKLHSMVKPDKAMRPGGRAQSTTVAVDRWKPLLVGGHWPTSGQRVPTRAARSLEARTESR